MQLEAPEASKETYRSRRYTIVAELAGDLGGAEVDPKDSFFSISFEGPDSPTCTVSFMDERALAYSLTLRFATCRTIASVEVVKGLEVSQGSPQANSHP